jgi:two-component system, OmpR family, catabolic regulation response regulator CreB
MSHILIVEDEIAIAEAVRLALNKAGHSSEIEGYGERALEHLLALDIAFDLVILDVGLPDLSGFEVCRRARQRYSAAQLPILFLTAHNEEIDRVLGLELSGGDYLTKPFSLRELVTRVRLLLSRHSTDSLPKVTGPQQNTNELGESTQEGTNQAIKKRGHEYRDFVWDELEAWASFRQKPLSLTLTEYKLLLVFLKQPKRVFSRQQLLDLSRGETHPSGERTIDTHIKSLRAKLREQSPQADIIRTHRGLGYSCE